LFLKNATGITGVSRHADEPLLDAFNAGFGSHGARYDPSHADVRWCPYDE
jgi:hypothetical protein